jgi:hypothetical protein
MLVATTQFANHTNAFTQTKVVMTGLTKGPQHQTINRDGKIMAQKLQWIITVV